LIRRIRSFGASAQTRELETSQASFTSGLAGAVAVTAAFVVNLLLPGSLLAALFTSVPAWRWFDPTPILASWDKQHRRRKVASREVPSADDGDDELKGLLE
jgi:hypothetical protein